jgi:TRAP transporter TAXI family solute receptor
MTGKTIPSWFLRRRPIVPALIAMLIGVAAIMPAARGGEEVFASVGTGELNRVYYPVGKAICEIVNRDLRTDGVRCSPEATPGSVYNINAVQSGELEFGIVQSDVGFAAYDGQGRWRGEPVRGVRSVMSLYPELVTIIARAGSQIQDLAGLKGRRVSVGAQNTGIRATWDAIETELGWRIGERVRPVGLRADGITSALCTGAVDATVSVVGHPSPLIKTQLAACKVNFVPIAGPAIDKLVRAHPYYQRGIIPAAVYGTAADVPTFGVRATLVTSTSVDARIVAVIARAVLTHVAELRALHPALARLKASEMINEGLTAPLHPAAAEVYKSLGLLE